MPFALTKAATLLEIPRPFKGAPLERIVILSIYAQNKKGTRNLRIPCGAPTWARTRDQKIMSVYVVAFF
jgi:hypothetical protein